MPRATSIQANQSFPTHSTFCPGDKIGAIICAVTLSKSRMQLRSGARIQRVLNKVPSLFWQLRYSFFLSSFHAPQTQHMNDPSSVSMPRCRGRPYIPTCYSSRFFQWWNTAFPHPTTELTNGALRRTNSGYFGYCNSHRLPDQTDLVIIELVTEDEPCVSFLSFIPPIFFPFLFASVR